MVNFGDAHGSHQAYERRALTRSSAIPSVSPTAKPAADDCNNTVVVAGVPFAATGSSCTYRQACPSPQN